MDLSFFFFKQKTAYEMRISDWSSDVCSSDLSIPPGAARQQLGKGEPRSSWHPHCRRLSATGTGLDYEPEATDALFRDLDAAVCIGLGAQLCQSQYRLAGYDYRSDEHTSELQSLMRLSCAVFCLKKTKST